MAMEKKIRPTKKLVDLKHFIFAFMQSITKGYFPIPYHVAVAA
jgi:hypothetical protein